MFETMMSQIGDFFMAHKGIAMIVNFLVKHADFIFGVIINLILISVFCKIADAFNKLHKDLYYYHKSSGLEIDFVTRYNNEPTLIEVKSNNGNAKSLKEILNNKDKYDISSNFKLADTNIGTTNGINTIPLYMAFLIK